jgi:hypothetical protein
VERIILHKAGDPVTLDESDHFRIKHVVSNKYLSETWSGALAMVDDYWSHFLLVPHPSFRNPQPSAQDQMRQSISLGRSVPQESESRLKMLTRKLC